MEIKIKSKMSEVSSKKMFESKKCDKFTILNAKTSKIATKTLKNEASCDSDSDSCSNEWSCYDSCFCEG
ncbi:MAG: hypothetical protein K1060chlam5_01047 [Candidatus Anoxychlamydiales bacterium]|nr:hypothetical protein [Candidatus Anoxychlamydiales bacterium]